MTAESLSFIDTNILVYAHDVDAGEKHATAREMVSELWNTRTGALSTQVLQEFYVTVTRKLPKPLDRTTARQLVREYSRWRMQPIRVSHIVSASEIEERYQLSFWDALIVAAAQHLGAARILSEDLQAGSTIAGIKIQNPLAR
jgi:predicted nucleic acid-binding protein